MPTYTNLSLGSTGEDVKKLQSALGVNPDGVFGEKTEAAVRKYQQENGIGVDGVAGNTTLNKLYGTGGSGVPDAVTQGMQQPAAPTYNPQYDAQINALFDKLMNRESFSYDAASDPLFQQYRDIYTQQGKMAMQDTMGQAAALTGGYGSSYGQSVGQQQYDAYLQKLNGMIPEFYGEAYEQYAAEGNDLKNQYSMLMNKDAQDYARYQDALSQYYGRQDANYQRLVSLITTTGYQPSAQELAEAGLTAEQAAAYRSYYTQQQAAAASRGGGGGGGNSKNKKTVQNGYFGDAVDSITAGLNNGSMTKQGALALVADMYSEGMISKAQKENLENFAKSYVRTSR